MEKNQVSKELLEGLVDRVVAQLKHRLAQEEAPSAQRMEWKSSVSEWESGVPEWKSNVPGSKKKLLLLGSLRDTERRSLADAYELMEEPGFLSDSYEPSGRMDSLSGFCEPAGESESRDWDFLLVAELSPRTMADVSHGIFGDVQSACILQGLLEGRPVYVLEQGLRYQDYKECASKTLYLFYQKQESMLKYMGVQFLRHVMDLPGLSGKSGHASQENPLDLTHLSLLQESELIRARGLGYRSICLKETAKVTPLAMDYVNRHGLVVYRR